jgi:hypothetical protein
MMMLNSAAYCTNNRLNMLMMLRFSIKLSQSGESPAAPEPSASSWRAGGTDRFKQSQDSVGHRAVNDHLSTLDCLFLC